VYAVDAAAEQVDAAYVLVPAGTDWRLAQVRLDAAGNGADLTRAVRPIPAGTPVLEVSGQRRLLSADDLAHWTALGLALTSADLVGLMRGVLDITVGYATDRRQFGIPVGSFQAVQHLLAEARCLMEASLSVALHASWAVDELGQNDACTAARVAKAYCARAARTVCETAVQVHGGIGNTWDCIVHAYLRRALLSSQWFGDDGEQLLQLQRSRLGVDTPVTPYSGRPPGPASG
jgi:alkylation response protein AidB-like acyl-CoA dehydrogenase